MAATGNDGIGLVVDTEPREPRRCVGCGGRFVPSAGPTQAYMQSSPGCWAAYGSVLKREYETPALFRAVHRLTVDAYALQHPGDLADRRAVQLVWVHYTSLYFVLDRGESFAAARGAMQRLAGKVFPPLPPARPTFDLTVADVIARPASEHGDAVRAWAEAAFRAWPALRDGAREMLAALRST